MSFESRVREEWPDEADTILAIVRGEKDPLDIPETLAWANSCYNEPKRVEKKMHALDVVLKGHGVEAVFAEGEMWPDMEYINMGDTYNTTIVLDHTRAKFMITSMGSWIESKGGRYL